MNIQINAISCVTFSKTLCELLAEFGYKDAVVATAVNGDFVPETMRENINLKDGDQIEILAPMQGG